MAYKQLLLTVVIAVAAMAYASAQTPASVLNAFKEKYPDVARTKWTAVDKGTYEADFERDSVAYTASFSNDGKWLQTESGVESADLPPVIQTALSNEYKGYLISDAELIDTHDRGRLYSVHLERGEETTMVLFDEDGKIISRENADDEG